MAILKKKDITAMNAGELQNKLNELRFELLKVNVQKSSKTPPRKIKEIKKTIARILTSIKKSSERDVIMLRNVNPKTKNISDVNKLNKGDKAKS